MLSSIPEAWGPKFQHDGGAVTRTHTGPDTIEFKAPAHMMIIMFNPQPGREIGLNSDRRAIGMAPMGSLEIVPDQSELFARWRKEKQSLLVAVQPERLRDLAGMEFDNETFELHPPTLGHTDRKAHKLACNMRYEIENRELAWRENLDALITAFSIHLLRNYSSLRPSPPRRFTGGMAPSTWRRINDFIHGHLNETLTLKQLAIIAGLSPSQLARAFRQTAGQSPHQYIIGCRLMLARHLIVSTDMPLEKISRTVGFSSNSHMTATMQRAWHKTPTDLRNEP